jgi:glycosyltransferase involved in cell wall biosynthesis
MRVLVVSHPPLEAELGAAQIALHLAAALRRRGHDARAWSPEPLPAGTRGWNLWRRQREGIERFAAAAGPFDVIDTPALTASPKVARAGRLVVRSVQPEMRYLLHGVARDLGRRPSPRALARALVGCRQGAAIVNGWRRGQKVLCLGSLELAWMRRRFPFWHAKLGCYDCAPAPAERAALAAVRRQRNAAGARAPLAEGVRFLWIGRWAAHKGTARLLRFLAARAVSHPADTLTLAGCGRGPERDLPAAWLRDGRVNIVATFERTALPALLAAHDAGLFTSDVEGWGLSLNEMLESGLPVYATAAGAVEDLLPFFPGTLRPFPPPDHGGVAPAAPVDLGANGYEARFNWDAIAGAYERQALAPGSGAG